MNQLRHFIKDTKSKNLTDKQIKQLYEWEKNDPDMSKTCEDCYGPKTNPSADLCYKCALKKAKSMGKTITIEQYNRG